MSTFSVDDYKLPDGYSEKVRQNFEYLRQIVREGKDVLKSSPSIDGYKLPDEWKWPELSLDKAKRSSEELFIPLTKEKGKNNMSKDIKVGDTAKFVGTVKEIQYNQNGEPSGYVVVDETTGIGSPIPALVTDKVDIHPELPESIGKTIRDNFSLLALTDKNYVKIDTEGLSYVDFLVDLINTIDNDVDYDWVEDNESDLYNAYTYGYTVAQDTTKYLYPVPHTDTKLYFYPLERPITKYSNLSVATYDHDSIDTFEFTESELNILGVSLDDVQLAQKTTEE